MFYVYVQGEVLNYGLSPTDLWKVFSPFSENLYVTFGNNLINTH